ncbi:hypothetical protein VAS14_15774 [Photobacterium angustum S14]|uniref:Uncharacterized protein n=2 Tax=Photobacterium angustum TaxID=661 RepID=Q1ZTH0_PHOAS|nr:hypothetical protein VAS14_15774 [Photobacterium angustum S14]
MFYLHCYKLLYRGVDTIDHAFITRSEKAISGARQSIKVIMVKTRADNYAQQIYQKLLGAELEMTIKSLYSADDLFMVGLTCHRTKEYRLLYI